MEIQQPAPNVIASTTGAPLVITKMNIPAWNMDTTPQLDVITTLNGLKILLIAGVIYADTGTFQYILNFANLQTTNVNELAVEFTADNPATIRLIRRTSGFFDSADFTSTAGRRGQLIILSSP